VFDFLLQRKHQTVEALAPSRATLHTRHDLTKISGVGCGDYFAKVTVSAEFVVVYAANRQWQRESVTNKGGVDIWIVTYATDISDTDSPKVLNHHA
jgi:hypothetical protein